MSYNKWFIFDKNGEKGFGDNNNVIIQHFIRSIAKITFLFSVSYDTIISYLGYNK